MRLDCKGKGADAPIYGHGMGALMSDQRSADDSDEKALGGPERRSGERYRSVWRIAKITREHDLGLWRVRNISTNGMMLSADVAVDIGEPLVIDLSENIRMTGQVVWAKDGRCGVSFDQPIDVGHVLTSLASEQRENGYRQPRLPFDHRAELYVDGETHQIQLVNLSQSGVGFIFHGQLDVGKPLGLMMPDKIRRTAVVRWMRGNQGGLWLTEPLAHSQLESISLLEVGPEEGA